MSLLPKLSLLGLAALLVVATGAAHAATTTYNFTYSGTGDFNGLTDTGSGSFAYTYTPGGAFGSLSAFNFTDTLHSFTGSSTYTYGLADVSSSAITLLPSGHFATLSISTDAKSGTSSSFGPASFTLFDALGAVADSTGGTNPFALNFLATFSAGTGTVTLQPTAVTPEPGSLSLLALGLASAVPAMRRKLRGATA